MDEYIIKITQTIPNAFLVLKTVHLIVTNVKSLLTKNIHRAIIVEIFLN